MADSYVDPHNLPQRKNFSSSLIDPEGTHLRREMGLSDLALGLILFMFRCSELLSLVGGAIIKGMADPSRWHH